MLLTFWLAYRMFNVPPGDALGLRPGTAIDFGAAGGTFVGLIVQILLLLVMAVAGSLIANRGIHLYTESRGLVVVEERSKKRNTSDKPAKDAPASETPTTDS
jgi:hypothetical protein